MRYGIEDIFNSINDIYYQFDEGEITENEANKLIEKCCHAFIKSKMTDNNIKMHYSLAVAFGQGILDGKQLDELLTLYKGKK